MLMNLTADDLILLRHRLNPGGHPPFSELTLKAMAGLMERLNQAYEQRDVKCDVQETIINSVPGFENLLNVLLDAYNQAAAPDGKGMARHGHGYDRFEDQPWHFLQNSFPGFCQGQAVKKIQESMGLPTYAAKRRELLGALVYTAMSIIFLDEQQLAPVETPAEPEPMMFKVNPVPPQGATLPTWEYLKRYGITHEPVPGSMKVKVYIKHPTVNGHIIAPDGNIVSNSVGYANGIEHTNEFTGRAVAREVLNQFGNLTHVPLQEVA